ncbi:MAG: glycosyltransferase N-terminal domain-containing protein [Akkermansiaceae bacterium]
MRLFLTLAIYQLVLPLLFLAAFPGWIVKMIRRGGFGTRLGERLGLYTRSADYEPNGAVHFHAVSVGESMLALKLIREWQRHAPERRFVLATGTATGHAVATGAGIPNLRVTYSPLDFKWMVRAYLARFEPAQIVLIEGEAWPHLLLACRDRRLPVSLVNARMSPRSARRYRKFATWLRPIYGTLDAVAIQEAADSQIWQDLGVAPDRIHDTGSLKFDPGSGGRPARLPEFQQMLDLMGNSRPVVLAASTHPGEELIIAAAIREAVPAALPVIVPRHAERRGEVKAALERAGFEVILRSAPAAPRDPDRACFVIDSTGELRDWTAHADAVVIGKSFLSTGGQNPTEAILAAKPVIFGPHMENFQPLAKHLLTVGGALCAPIPSDLSAAIRIALDPDHAAEMTRAAADSLARHDGATRRILALLTGENPAYFDASGVCHFQNQSLESRP